MREDVKDLLERATASFEPTPVEPEEVVRLEQRRQRRTRIGTAFVALAVFAAAGLLTWNAFAPRRPLQPGGGDFESGSYVMDHIKVTYPYVSPRADADPGFAGVEFRSTWTHDTFPGDHNCTVTAYDAAGMVGETRIELSSLSRVAVWDHPVAVPVTSEPTVASVTCDAQRLDTPVAFVVSDPRVEPVTEGGRVSGFRYSFRVDAPPNVRPPEYVGTNVCVVLLRTSTGKELFHGRLTVTTLAPHTVSSKILRELAGNVDTRLTLNVSCEPFTGTGVDAVSKGGQYVSNPAAHSAS